MPETTKEEKDFLNDIRAAKQMGFIAQMSGRGKSASEIRNLHARYVTLDTKRENKFNDARNAILGSE